MRKLILLALIFVLGLNSVLYAATSKAYREEQKTLLPYDIRMNSLYKAKVVRVVDGDTAIFTLMIDDGQKYKDERVRFTGVNTPETVHPNKPVEYYGKEASNFTKSKLTAGKIVWLQTDVGARDRYSRMLAYVWIEKPENVDDEKEVREKMFNSTLLLEGYAQTSSVQPNTKYSRLFAEFQKEARENNKGLWNQK